MTITDEQLKGNWAEQYIASELASQDCFVRHVTQGHDSGIDLYCETVKDSKPFLHFWCQIKTRKRLKGKRKQISFTEKKHRKYWLNQPVPVFIFLVPDLRDECNIPYYICRACDLWYKEKIISFLKIESREQLSTFLNERLAIENVRWQLKEGKVDYLKTPENERIKQFLSGIVQDFEPQFLNSLCWSLWRLSQDILFHGINSKVMLEKARLDDDEKERFNNAKPYMKVLEILTVDKNIENYAYYATLGVYYELRGMTQLNKSEKEYTESIAYYEKSLSTIDGSEPLWKDTIKDIHQHIERVKSKI